jgi:formamidopyrimidine-DNA glycosylase
MPELPEVQTVLNGVVEYLKSRKIMGLECFYPGTVRIDPRVGKKPFPASVTGHSRRGKYMLLHLSGGNSLIIHLRMTGKLVRGKDKDASSIHERACFMLARGERLHFIDPRTFGKIVLCRTDDIQEFLPHLGFEPLEDEFTSNALANALARRKMPVKNAIMDQRIIAGLGNIYACEILYRAGIDPDTPAGSLSKASLQKLVLHTKQVLTEALEQNGTSISDFRRIDDKQGGFQDFLMVYQKETCPKGHKVLKKRHGGRGTFYCPVCQK